MSTAVSNYSYTECTRKASHQSQEQPCFTDDLAERSKRYHKSLFKNTSISAPAEEPVNHLVEQVTGGSRITVKAVKERVVTDNRSILEWLREVELTSDKRRPDKNYVDENGLKQRNSILMAKLDSELLLRQRANSKDHTLIDKTIEFLSSWYTYAINLIWSKAGSSNKRTERDHH